MKTVLGLLLGLGVGVACFAEGQPTVFYAQLIRATDREAQEVGWRPIGPKLSTKLCPKFRWKNYWEVNRQTLNVPSGQKTRVRLNADREVEIELRSAGDSEIRLYTAGKVVQKTRQSPQEKMSIIGGARENDESWFVVIRRDKPTME